MVCPACYVILVFIAYIAYKFIPEILRQRKLDRWVESKCPKDVVVLHGPPRSKSSPALSPFVLKLETYLRMNKIPYQFDDKDVFGPKGKTPWITLNGKHVADSELCIEFLSKKFGDRIGTNRKYTNRDRAIAHASRVLLEDRMFWEIVMWGFVWDGLGPATIQKFMKIPWLLVKYIGYKYKKAVWNQGMGRHSREDIERWTVEDMRTISEILGNNKFLLGDEPCVEDCAVFGFCSQLIWGFSSYSPYAAYLNDEMLNVKEYCVRMKELYYPDWDELLVKEK